MFQWFRKRKFPKSQTKVKSRFPRERERTPEAGSGSKLEVRSITGASLSDGISNNAKRSWIYTENYKIREELVLKPITLAKMTPPRFAPTGATRARNAHVLQAVLILVKELDRDSFEIVDTAIKKRLDVL